MSKPFHLSEYENALVHYIAKCGDTQPKTIADIGKCNYIPHLVSYYSSAKELCFLYFSLANGFHNDEDALRIS